MAAIDLSPGVASALYARGQWSLGLGSGSTRPAPTGTSSCAMASSQMKEGYTAACDAEDLQDRASRDGMICFTDSGSRRGRGMSRGELRREIQTRMWEELKVEYLFIWFIVVVGILQVFQDVINALPFRITTNLEGSLKYTLAAVATGAHALSMMVLRAGKSEDNATAGGKGK